MGKLIKRIIIGLLILVGGGLALIFFFGDDEEETRPSDYYQESNTGLQQTTTKTDEGEVQKTNTTSINFDGILREPRVKLKGNGDDNVTIMVYMNGSDLESDDSEATTDLKEMIAAGGSEKVNILVQTMGTKKWNKSLGVASDRSQIYCINQDGFNLVNDNLGQLDCTSSKTLSDFVTWSAKNYPADRYELIFWNHGGGPVYGFGNDQYQDEYAALTVDEIQSALRNAGVYFDFIGMDCCIMSSLEVGCALYDVCDYMILSEDFESGLGWSYSPWLKELYKNTSIPTPELGRYIVDSMIADNKNENEEGILAVIDESMMKVLYSAWTKFAYANEDALSGNNYSQKRTRALGGRVSPVLKDRGFFSSWLENFGGDNTSLADYYITDIMAVAQNINSEESDALASTLSKALVYVGATSGDATLTGISVTIPYGDSDFYDELQTIFLNCGFDKTYIDWLSQFVDASGAESFFDFGSWFNTWTGWDDYEDDWDWDTDEYYDYDEDEDYGLSIWDFLFGDDFDDYDSDDSWYSDYDDDWGWNDDDWQWDDDFYDYDWDWNDDYSDYDRDWDTDYYDDDWGWDDDWDW